MRYKLFLSVLLLSSSFVLKAQVNDTIKQGDNAHTPYELLTSYYNTDFKPFKKGTIYTGISMSLEDRSQENTENIFEKVIEGDRINFNVLVKGGYFINDYTMLGLNLNIFENKFEGTLLVDSETVESSSLKRGFSITPNYRTSIPLSKNERLSFFTSAGLTFGKSSTLKREVKNLDEIQKSFSDSYNLGLGLSPGVTFFAMEDFALEVQLDVISYELNIENNTKNGTEESREVRHNVDFKLDILSVKIGIAYYL